MPFTCSQCGAVFAGEETCQDRFNVSQLKEIEQPAYYAVHHLCKAQGEDLRDQAGHMEPPIKHGRLGLHVGLAS